MRSLSILALALAFMSCSCAAFAKKSVARVDVPALPDKSIEIRDVDESNMASAAMALLDLVQKDEKVVLFRINSFGGSIYSGLKFIQFVEDVKKSSGITTICVVDTKAMSMGFAIFESNVCDHRLMTKRSTLLAHHASTQVQGNVNDVREALSMLEKLDLALSEMIGVRLTVGVEGYRSRIDRSAWIMDWQEALTVGAIDGTINPMAIPVPIN